jgi:hypothetical protein
MSIYNYTLPSGAKYQVTVPAGTTQAQADDIFYSQVAAGTFVGYEIGDTLINPTQALENFGITRLQRGTAGVDDQTLLAIISGLPIVASLPSLTSQPVANPIDQSSYIQVTSTPTGTVNLSLQAGQLTPQQTQSLMAQMAANANNTPATFTQADGIGLYGFNCNQLEQAGIVKPGMSQLYCPLDSNGNNPANFVSFMSSPTPWTGLYGITSINDLLNDAGLQNEIQQDLLQQTYDQLVYSGVVVPPKPKVTTASITTGLVYNSSGTLVSASPLSLLVAGHNDATSLQNSFLSTLGVAGSTTNKLFTDLAGTPLGSVPAAIQNFGSAAVAQYTSGLASLSTGAVGFATGALNGVTAATGAVATQLSGLSTGLVGGAVASAASVIQSTVNGDVGALMAVGSKYGTSIASAWSSTTDSISALGSSVTTGVGSLAAGIGSSVSGLASNITASAGAIASGIQNQVTALSSGISSLAKSAQASINFSDFSLSSLISRVQPAAGFTNTVNRATVDAAVVRIIGSPLITPPVYELPSIKSLGSALDIKTAQNLLSKTQSLANGASGLLTGITGGNNPLQGALSQVQSVISSAQNVQQTANNVVSQAKRLTNSILPPGK